MNCFICVGGGVLIIKLVVLLEVCLGKDSRIILLVTFHIKEPGPARSPPEAPSRMELTATPSRINIQWEPSRGDTTGYRIRLTDPATGETDTVEVDQFQQSYAFTDLDPEKQYEVSIESFNDEGYSRPEVDRVTTGAHFEEYISSTAMFICGIYCLAIKTQHIEF